MNPPTLDELNAIQQQWMKLDPTESTEAERQKVFAQMRRLPRAHCSVSNDGKQANVMVDGGPMWALSRPTQDAVRWLKEFNHPGTRTDVAWCGAKGEWVAI